MSVSSLGMALGALASGMILQKEAIKIPTQMGLGAFLVGVGILTTFPRQTMSLLYNYSPIIAFPAAFITGFGDPFMTNSSLKCMYQLQVSFNNTVIIYT